MRKNSSIIWNIYMYLLRLSYSTDRLNILNDAFTRVSDSSESTPIYHHNVKRSFIVYASKRYVYAALYDTWCIVHHDSR